MKKSDKKGTGQGGGGSCLNLASTAFVCHFEKSATTGGMSVPGTDIMQRGHPLKTPIEIDDGANEAGGDIECGRKEPFENNCG